KADVLLPVGTGLPPTQHQRAEDAISAHHGQRASSAQSARQQHGLAIEVEKQGIVAESSADLTRGKYLTGEGAFPRPDGSILKHPFTARKVQRGESALVPLSLREQDESRIRSGDTASPNGGSPEDISRRVTRDRALSQVEQEPQALLLPLELAMAEHVVHGHRNLIGYHSQQCSVVLTVSWPLGSDGHATERAVGGCQGKRMHRFERKLPGDSAWHGKVVIEARAGHDSELHHTVGPRLPRGGSI